MHTTDPSTTWRREVLRFVLGQIVVTLGTILVVAAALAALAAVGGGDLPLRLAALFAGAYAVVSALDVARHLAALQEQRQDLRQGDLSWRPSRTVALRGDPEPTLAEIQVRCAAELGEGWQVEEASPGSARLRRRRKPPLMLVIRAERRDDGAVRATIQARTDFWRRPDRGASLRLLRTVADRIGV